MAAGSKKLINFVWKPIRDGKIKKMQVKQEKNSKRILWKQSGKVWTGSGQGPMAGCDVQVGEICGFNTSKNFLNGQITNRLRRSRTTEVITFTTHVRKCT